jgi:hypothetical protein
MPDRPIILENLDTGFRVIATLPEDEAPVGCVLDPAGRAVLEVERDGHDVPSTTVHVHFEVADALLTAAGFEKQGGAYVLIDGTRFWERDEALTMALAILATVVSS